MRVWGENSRKKNQSCDMTVKFVPDLIQRSRFRLLFLKTSNDFIFYPTIDF